MWKVQTGYRATLWCTLIMFTRADGQCFMSPIILHQSKEYSEDLHFNTSLEWTVRHKPSGYMDRYGWLKSMNRFSAICGTSPVNNQIISFGGYYSHFDDRLLIHMEHQNIRTFLLKAGNSINDQTNYNIPNAKLKSLHNEVKYYWIMKYGTTKMLPHHMKSILVVAWDAFNMSAGKFIRDSFEKTKLHPLSPPNLTMNTQTCSASEQVPYVSKADEIN